MKRITHIGIWWDPRKPPEELEKDKTRIAEILRRMGMGSLFHPEQHFYDFHLEAGSKALETLVEELQTTPHLADSHIWVETRYTRQELESAAMLIWGPTNQAIEDDYYDFSAEGEEHRDLYKYCPACGAPIGQIRDFIAHKALMRGKEVSLTYSNQVILSERVGHLLQEHSLTGFELRPVRHYKKPYKGEPTLYQLKVTNMLPPMASPPTEFERIQHCEVCGTTTRYLKHTHFWGKIQYYEDTDIYYPKGVLEVVKDFNYTAEKFEELRVAHPYVIITQRVYRLLHEHKVKNWAAVPVYLVD
ncbi:MAG: hypothetical protein H5T64_09210 [Chloroflexi bacterium]|nr:hypothetical protein [Chloroflexota bacterium]